MLEGILLEFQTGALKEMVKLALKKKAGARALRSVMEENLMELMYQIPDMNGIERVAITKDMIINGKDPIFKTARKRKTA